VALYLLAPLFEREILDACYRLFCGAGETMSARSLRMRSQTAVFWVGCWFGVYVRNKR